MKATRDRVQLLSRDQLLLPRFRKQSAVKELKQQHTRKCFKKDFGTLIYALRTRFPEARIYWHQAIDMRKVPSLPKLLGWILSMRAQLINRKGAQLCLERGIVCVPPLKVEDANGFCRDGFHANEMGYEAWAAHLIDHLALTPRSSPAVAPFIR